MDTKVTIYTDGSSQGNPGPGGYGTVILYTDKKGVCHRREYCAGYKNTTNNRMELLAAIVGLEALNRPCDVTLYSDSKYFIDAFEKHWIEKWQQNGWKRNRKEDVKNVDLWKRLLRAIKPHDVHLMWLKGHAGHPENERCDRMAVEAAQRENLLEDTEGMI